MRRKWDGSLCLVGLRFRTKLLARARDGDSLFVKQLLDAYDAFHIAPAIHALPGAALYWLQLRKLGLPKAQHIGGQLAQGGYFSDAEIELVGDEDLIRLALVRALFPWRHFLETTGRAGCRMPIVTQPPRVETGILMPLQGQVSFAAPKTLSGTPSSGFLAVPAG